MLFLLYLGVMTQRILKTRVACSERKKTCLKFGLILGLTFPSFKEPGPDVFHCVLVFFHCFNRFLGGIA